MNASPVDECGLFVGDNIVLDFQKISYGTRDANGVLLWFPALGGALRLSGPAEEPVWSAYLAWAKAESVRRSNAEAVKA